ncbi:ATP-binding protein [Caldimonas sp. KR1-144]|uniref:ATP-binding protein n=1 Tax=Caldimonas sp. KR1-144 TaxID=3400911 RepID=UPI003C06865D
MTSRATGPRSLRWRLLTATLIAVAAAMLLAGWWLSALFREHVTRQFAELLTAQLDQVVAAVEPGSAGEPTLDPAALSDPRWQRPYSGLYWQVDEAAGGSGRVALRSRSLWDAQLAVPADRPADGEVHVHEVRGPAGASLLLVERSVRIDGAARAPWRVLVAADVRETQAAARRFDGVLAASLGVLCALLLVVAVAQVTLGLAPLHALQRALLDVREGRAQRLSGRFPSEVQPLVDDFNGVLDRNAAIVARARAHAGNLAHALKTPLAALMQAAAGARQRPAALAELPALVDEQAGLARRHVDWHLARARAAAARGVPGVHTEVAPVIDGLLRVMGRVHADRGLRLAADRVEPGLVFAGEAEDLHEMVGNLLDNACKWARGAVEVSAARLPGDGPPRLHITIDDDGPGIASERRESALARGARLDESVSGSGLGLAIVQELAALHDGELRLASAPAGGLRVDLVLPSWRGTRA